MSEPDEIAVAEAAMKARMSECLGSPSEQAERLEDLIDALDATHASGIDRSAPSFWRTARERKL